jgi:outer membrane lipoprotein-sorting protein
MRMWIIAALLTWPACSLISAGDDVFERSRAVYAALHSYADTGVVTLQYAQSQERHTFTTRFRSPRRFYFDFQKDSGDRFVFWSDEETFHTWWKSTGVQQDYPKGKGVQAFGPAEYLTSGSALKIPTLLFSQAGLQGAFTHFSDPLAAGSENLDGHQCYRITGTAKDVYAATGRETNIRAMTVWIDSESLLIRKVFEDAPKGTAAAASIRVTTTFDPQANPALDDKQFQFTPEAPK